MTAHNLALFIGILDDEPDRTGAMLPLLAGRYPDYEVAVFENAPDMIEWLASHLDRICLLSLDHDLGPNQTRDGSTFDPGTGRDVADFLATHSPRCPILLHTTNRLAAPGMRMVLKDSGWNVSQVVPYGNLAWVGEVWISEVCRAVSRFQAEHP